MILSPQPFLVPIPLKQLTFAVSPDTPVEISIDKSRGGALGSHAKLLGGSRSLINTDDDEHEVLVVKAKIIADEMDRAVLAIVEMMELSPEDGSAEGRVASGQVGEVADKAGDVMREGGKKVGKEADELKEGAKSGAKKSAGAMRKALEAAKNQVQALRQAVGQYAQSLEERAAWASNRAWKNVVGLEEAVAGTAAAVGSAAWKTAVGAEHVVEKAATGVAKGVVDAEEAAKHKVLDAADAVKTGGSAVLECGEGYVHCVEETYQAKRAGEPAPKCCMKPGGSSTDGTARQTDGAHLLTEDLKNIAAEAVRGAEARVGEVAGSASEAAGFAGNTAAQGLDAVRGAGKDAARQADEASKYVVDTASKVPKDAWDFATDAAESVYHAPQQAVEYVSKRTGRVYKRAADCADDYYERAIDAGGDAKDWLAHRARVAEGSLEDTWQRVREGALQWLYRLPPFIYSLNRLLYLTAFAVALGCVLWSTFVAEPALAARLPRKQAEAVSSILVPASYWLVGPSALACLIIYVRAHTAGGSLLQWDQVAALLVPVLSSAANLFLFYPAAEREISKMPLTEEDFYIRPPARKVVTRVSKRTKQTATVLADNAAPPAVVEEEDQAATVEAVSDEGAAGVVVAAARRIAATARGVRAGDVARSALSPVALSRMADYASLCGLTWHLWYLANHLML